MENSLQPMPYFKIKMKKNRFLLFILLSSSLTINAQNTWEPTRFQKEVDAIVTKYQNTAITEKAPIDFTGSSSIPF